MDLAAWRPQFMITGLSLLDKARKQFTAQAVIDLFREAENGVNQVCTDPIEIFGRDSGVWNSKDPNSVFNGSDKFSPFLDQLFRDISYLVFRLSDIIQHDRKMSWNLPDPVREAKRNIIVEELLTNFLPLIAKMVLLDHYQHLCFVKISPGNMRPVLHMAHWERRRNDLADEFVRRLREISVFRNVEISRSRLKDRTNTSILELFSYAPAFLWKAPDGKIYVNYRYYLPDARRLPPNLYVPILYDDNLLRQIRDQLQPEPSSPPSKRICLESKVQRISDDPSLKWATLGHFLA